VTNVKEEVFKSNSKAFFKILLPSTGIFNQSACVVKAILFNRLGVNKINKILIIFMALSALSPSAITGSIF